MDILYLVMVAVCAVQKHSKLVGVIRSQQNTGNHRDSAPPHPPLLTFMAALIPKDLN